MCMITSARPKRSQDENRRAPFTREEEAGGSCLSNTLLGSEYAKDLRLSRPSILMRMERSRS